MSHNTPAILATGFSENKRFVGPFAEALTAGPDRLFPDVEIAYLGDVLHRPDEYEKRFQGATVITTSAGIMCVHSCARIVAINGVEPTPLHGVVSGALRVMGDKTEPEEGIIIDGMMTPLREIMRHPIHNMKVPFMVGRFSTARHLTRNKGYYYPGGRVLMAGSRDGFRFTRDEALKHARDNGVHVVEFDGGHNYAYLRPKATVEMIRQAFNAIES